MQDAAAVVALHWDGGAQLEQELGSRVGDPSALIPLAMQAKQQLDEVEQRLRGLLYLKLQHARLLGAATDLTAEEAARKCTFEEAVEYYKMKAAWLDQKLREAMSR
jgi:hypothetical protein